MKIKLNLRQVFFQLFPDIEKGQTGVDIAAIKGYQFQMHLFHGVAKTPIYGVVAHLCSFGILKYGLTHKNTLLLGVSLRSLTCISNLLLSHPGIFNEIIST